MFGCCVAGRLLQTNLQQVDESHAIFELPNANTINHICVFLLGTVPFPEGYGATVHFYWPGKGFQLLGMLSNDKPSAIFRLRGTFTAQSTDTHAVFSGAATSDITAILGLSIEPLPRIMLEVATLPSALARGGNPAADATLMAERIVKHLFNYISGFQHYIFGTAVPHLDPKRSACPISCCP
ncbi:Protein OPI10 [Grifola frondosa]|uniref:Protein OPI10 n=1 Tax=Grifola frondosa TaxID=5627 RepID=A0A1C7LNW2_GRIFR|nr:Protein OPI10 [Grifola frondosa]